MGEKLKENKKLIDFRKKNLKLTQEEMAGKLNVSTSYYQKIENGERNPSFNFINKFKSVFGNADIDELFFNNKLHITCIKEKIT